MRELRVEDIRAGRAVLTAHWAHLLCQRKTTQKLAQACTMHLGIVGKKADDMARPFYSAGRRYTQATLPTALALLS